MIPPQDETEFLFLKSLNKGFASHTYFLFKPNWSCWAAEVLKTVLMLELLKNAKSA